MSISGESPDNPRLVNLTTPVEELSINGMKVDMHRFAQAANALGAQADDVLSISGYRNARGELVPDYDSIRIEVKAQ